MKPKPLVVFFILSLTLGCGLLITTVRADSTNSVPDKFPLARMVETSQKFLADAQAHLGGYATEEQTKRIAKHMQQNGLDETELKKQVADVSAWLAHDATKDAPEPGTPGRYQLVSAVTETLVDGRAAIRHEQLFRLDTATGQVWKFSSGVEKGKLSEYWIPVSEKGNITNSPPK